MKILAIDPGCTQSAFVVYDSGRRAPILFDKLDNGELLKMLQQEQDRLGYPFGERIDELAIEMIASYGMPVGKEVFETCVWLGRFIQAFDGSYQYVYRKDVKMHLCGSCRAKDGNVRQALIDIFGPSKREAIGLKASPGPLYGFAKDAWAALAVAITHAARTKAAQLLGRSRAGNGEGKYLKFDTNVASLATLERWNDAKPQR